MGGSVTNTCVICDRPTPDGYADVACGVERPRQLLAEITDMLPAALDVAHRQARHGTGGGASGKPGSALPLDLGATARLDGVQTALTKWVDRIAVTRGTTRPWFNHHGHPIAVAAHWLTPHLEWLRHQPTHEPDQHGNTWSTEQWLRDVEACARIVRGIARGPADRVYLGPCGAYVGIECKVCQATDIDHHRECDVTCPHKFIPAGTCDGDVYGLPDGDTGRCRQCGAEFDQGERQRWLTDEVRQRAYRASELEHAYGLNSATVRKWAERKLIAAHGQDGQGRPLYLLGEVLDLAASEAARREQARQKRERRKAAQTAGMGA
jgi:hypothetical protein